MNEFWTKEWARHPDAEGIDFVPLGWRPWLKPDSVIIQSNIKADFDNPNFCYPRSSRLFWKMVNGEKQYILESPMVESFHQEFCNYCGSQRCPGDAEAIASCGYFNNNKPKPSPKIADIRLEYNLTLSPMDVGLDDNCSYEEFNAAVNGYLTRLYNEVEPALGIPYETESDLLGF